jgi:uncharacterized protein
VALTAFLFLTGFFSVLLRPMSPPGPAGEPPTAVTEVAATVETKVHITPPELSPSPALELQPTPTLPIPPRESSPTHDLAPEPAIPPGPKVAILVANLGLSPALAQNAISLSPEIGLGFSPYGRDLSRMAAAARAKGHEVWAGIPMQPRRYPAIDPGENTLLVTVSPVENVRRFGWALGQIQGSRVGIYNMMGSAFTANDTALRPILQAAAQQQLAFLDTRSGGDTLGPKIARELGLSAVLATGFIDDDPGQLEARLAALLNIAHKNGSAVGLVEPNDRTFAILRRWTDRLAGGDVKLVPVSVIARESTLK